MVVKVPKLIGLDETDAKAQLDKASLRLVRNRDIQKASVEAGKVAEQEPLAGSELRAGDAVKLNFASKVQKVNLPKVAGKAKSEAKKVLEELGLKVAVVESEGEGDPGTVLGTKPETDAEVEANAEIQLLVVAEGELVEIPKLRGRSFRRARRKLEELGLKVGKTKHDYNDTLPEGAVIRMKPSAGEKVAKGSEIEVLVND